MKKIKLTKGQFALVDNEDFEYLNQFNWTSHTAGYAVGHVNKKLIFMHRLINKTPKGFETDHINRNKLDNRKSNLRSVTQAQNRFNTGLQKNNTSGYKGVIWNKDKNIWFACIYKNRRRIYLGSSKNILSAYELRKQAEEMFIKS